MGRETVRSELSSSRLFSVESSKDLENREVDATYYNFMTSSFKTNEYLHDSTQFGVLAPVIYQMDLLREDVGSIHNEVSASAYTDTINSGSLVSEIKAFTARDTTPSVKNGYIFVTANDRPVSITAFDDPTEGQQITIIIKDANTDFTNGGVGGRVTNRLVLNGNANWTTCTTGDSISFIHNDGVWVETHRSDNT